MSIDSAARFFLGYVPDASRYAHPDYSPYEAHMLIESLIKNDSRVLDVGCGTGALGILLASRKKVVYEGIEPMAARAKIARESGLHVHSVYLNREFVAKHEGSFDHIVLADVLEHLADPWDILRMSSKLLNETGSLVVSVPNVAHWSSRFSLLVGKFDYQEVGIYDATHLRWFTPRTLERCLGNAGFRVSCKKYSSGLWMNEYKKLRRLASYAFPDSIVRRAFNAVVVRMPSLFACQLIYECRVPD